ncbi:endonuclease/exonuclease/phosphatase family protein [Gimesia fumaroli]|uniref:endonuclease/exonuclease/phosphatase family protein n=1 Tax=Gimesia fumaroli TaxID=2527976 RepID=UPI0036F3B25B
MWGGDFNANPRDPIFRELPASLQDAFSTAGAGWGNTITNEFPFLRIDQIWSNDAFQPLNVVSEPAFDTDHRVVITDLMFE